MVREGWDHQALMDMPAEELAGWVREAVDLHNYLNKSPDT